MTRKPKPPTAITYARVSSKSQADKNSIESQRVQLPNFAAAFGWKVVESFEDDGIPGKELANRPGALAVMEYLRTTGADYFLICDSSRWGRFAKTKGPGASARLLAEVDVLIDVCVETGTILRTTDGLTFDPNAGDVIEQRNAFTAGLSAAGKANRLLGRKVARSKIVRLTRGEYAYGMTPYGLRFDRVKRVFVEYQPESKHLKRMFKWYAAGDSDVAISKKSRDRNVPTSSQRNGPNSSTWKQTTVRTILNNPVYITGKIVVSIRDAFERYREACLTDGVALDLPDSIVPENGVVEFPAPVLIDERTWTHCQELRKGKLSRPGPTAKTDACLFQPFIKCGLCGRSFEHGHVKRGKYCYYGCKGHRSEKYRDGKPYCDMPRFTAGEADSNLWEITWSRLLQPSKTLAEWHRGKRQGRPAAEIQGEIVDLDKAIAAADDERRRYLKLFGKGNIPAADLDGLVSEVAERITGLEADRRRLAAELTATNGRDIDADALHDRAAKLQTMFAGAAGSKIRKQIDGLSFADKRKLLSYVLRGRGIALISDKALPPEDCIEVKHGVALDFMELPVDPARLLDGLDAVGIKPVLGSIRASRSPVARARPGPARPGCRGPRRGRRFR